jgi:epoxyqueuosine reductase
VTVERLEQLGAYLRANGAQYTRSFADAGPLPERELARRAGLGWIGKNTMLIRPHAGSFFFIGSVLTDLPLALDIPYPTDHCGSCTRCLEACPTGALVEPRVLDATRCISYLTIEHKGPLPQPLQTRLEGWAFGCDVCNNVCPWNERFATPTPIADFRPRTRALRASLERVPAMTEAEFAEEFADSPLARPGLRGMQRNLRAAMAGATASTT